MDGTGTELRYQTGVRNRGHGSATLQPQSFSVAIPNDRDWNGRTALNLNAQYSYLQLLGSAFMRHAGVVAANCAAADREHTSDNDDENALHDRPIAFSGNAPASTPCAQTR